VVVQGLGFSLQFYASRSQTSTNPQAPGLVNPDSCARGRGGDAESLVCWMLSPRRGLCVAAALLVKAGHSFPPCSLFGRIVNLRFWQQRSSGEAGPGQVRLGPVGDGQRLGGLCACCAPACVCGPTCSLMQDYYCATLRSALLGPPRNPCCKLDWTSWKPAKSICELFASRLSKRPGGWSKRSS